MTDSKLKKLMFGGSTIKVQEPAWKRKWRSLGLTGYGKKKRVRI